MDYQIIQLSWANIGAIVGAIVPIFTLIITVQQLSSARKHNRISVQPILNVWQQHNSFTNPSNQAIEFHYKISLGNIGVGPALIECFDVLVDDKKIIGSGTTPIDNAVSILFPTSNPHIEYRSYLSKGGVLAANGSILVLHMIFLNGSQPPPIVLEHTMRRAKLIVRYKSIYGEEFMLDTSQSV